jgi:hypothetical protein
MQCFTTNEGISQQISNSPAGKSRSRIASEQPTIRELRKHGLRTEEFSPDRVARCRTWLTCLSRRLFSRPPNIYPEIPSDGLIGTISHEHCGLGQRERCG